MTGSPQSLIDSLLRDQITTLERNLNRRLDATEKTVNDRFDKQDQALVEIKKQTQITNGRVTVLEKARERAQGVIFAFRWLPVVLSSLLTGGLTYLILILTGSPH